mgnify:CR=1 FL=1
MEVLPLLSDEAPKLGEQAVAIGNPLGVRWSTTFGMFSNVNSTDEIMPSQTDVHQTDAAINPGNSGGPLLVLRDGEYKVAGMNTFAMTPTGANVGLGFAVPATLIKPALDAVLAGNPVVLPSFGGNVEAVSQMAAEIAGVPATYRDDQANGVFVSAVAEGGALEKAGIRVGDILLEINHQKLQSAVDFNRLEQSATLYNPVPVAYLRDGAVRETVMTAQNIWGDSVEPVNGDSTQPDDVSSATNPLEAYGFKLMDKTDKIYQIAFGEDHPAESPVVAGVRNHSPAHYYGFEQEHFLTAISFEGMPRQEVETIADIENLFAQAAAEGINTDRALFYLVAYSKKDGEVVKKVLAPIAADVNAVPLPNT